MSDKPLSNKPTRILIVDDDFDTLEIISEYLTGLDIGIIPNTTTDPTQIIPILRKFADVQLLLSELRMPRIDSIKLLSEIRENFPRLILLLMTGFGVDNLKKQAIELDVYKFIEKPFDLPELTGIIQDALRGHDAGFGGLIESMQLPDIIQMLAVSTRTVALTMSRGTQKATIHFDRGEIVHAVCGQVIGEQVILDVFAWTGGRFNLEALPTPEERTITQSWQALLLEAARQRDEEAGVSGEKEDSPETQLESGISFADLEAASGGESFPDVGDSLFGVVDEAAIDGLKFEEDRKYLTEPGKDGGSGESDIENGGSPLVF